MQELNFENIKKNWQNSNHNFNFEKAIKKQKLETYKNLTSIFLGSSFISTLISLLIFFLCKSPARYQHYTSACIYVVRRLWN